MVTRSVPVEFNKSMVTCMVTRVVTRGNALENLSELVLKSVETFGIGLLY